MQVTPGEAAALSARKQSELLRDISDSTFYSHTEIVELETMNTVRGLTA